MIMPYLNNNLSWQLALIAICELIVLVVLAKLWGKSAIPSEHKKADCDEESLNSDSILKYNRDTNTYQFIFTRESMQRDKNQEKD